MSATLRGWCGLSRYALDRIYDQADGWPTKRAVVRLYRATEPDFGEPMVDRCRELDRPALVVWGAISPTSQSSRPIVKESRFLLRGSRCGGVRQLVLNARQSGLGGLDLALQLGLQALCILRRGRVGGALLGRSTTSPPSTWPA